MESVTFDLERMDPQHSRIVKARILVKERDTAKQAKNFTKADALRDKLKELGVEVFDQINGPTGWKFADGSSKKLPPGTAVPAQAMRPRQTETTESDTGKSNKKRSLDDDSERKTKKEKTSTSSQNKEKSSNKPEVQSSAEKSRNLSMLSNVLGANAGSTIVQGVTIVDTQIGTGKVAVAGQKAIVHYVGKLKNGKIFDSSAKKPFSFMLGRGQVIRGWDIGVVGMKVGGKRQLTIPPEKAYGRQGAPPTIPGNATLIFDITLIDTK